MKSLQIVLLFIISSTIYSQNQNYTVAKIPKDLMENANAVVRLNEQSIEISSRKSMVITSKRVVTILNDNGLNHMNAGEYASGSSKIKSIEAVILNKDGQEIKKVKRRDFKENSVSEGSIVTDNTLLFLDYTPVIYPFTLVYESVVETSNTAFIPSWYPVESTLVGVESTSIRIVYLPELGFKYKEFNFEVVPEIKKEETATSIKFSATNIAPFKNEEYSPSYQSFFPNVMFGLTNFNLEGVEGVASDWKTFGSWMYESLLKNTTEIPKETQIVIKQLVGNEKDPLKITKIIYQYVQNKTRYISIQLGIGGWKPMLAKDVDRLGYGDCKALTNYTRSLLQTVGIPSYYTVIYGDRDLRSLQSDFVSMQGNHVILAVPIEEKMYWLECTSQENPFGFQGDFTDNRLALVVKPEGGEIIRTHEFKTDENSQISSGSFTVNAVGTLSGSVVIKSKGTQYDNKFGNEKKSAEDRSKFYKNYFWHINNINLQKINLANNKETVEFQEEITFEAASYGTVNAGRMMFSLNVFNPVSSVPKRYRTRNNPFEIDRGFYDYDDITIHLPEGYTIEAKPDDYELTDKFGYYKTQYKIVDEKTVQYTRMYRIDSGFHDKSEYDNFRKFRENIAKTDNAKIVLIKKP
jgi:transglutaminase-like putative cysteine protease